MARGYVIRKQSEVSASNIFLFYTSKVRLGLQYCTLLEDRSPTLNKFWCYYRPTLSQRTNLLWLVYFFLSLVWIIDHNFNEGKALIYYDQIILTCRVYQYGIMTLVQTSTELKRSVVLRCLDLAVSTAECAFSNLHCTNVHRSSFMTWPVHDHRVVNDFVRRLIVSVSIATSNHNSKDRLFDCHW